MASKLVCSTCWVPMTLLISDFLDLGIYIEIQLYNKMYEISASAHSQVHIYNHMSSF